ncbi:single stranded DNA-binding protein [Paraburkholderia youngii]
MNKVILAGNLEADCPVRAVLCSDEAANIRLATTDRYKDKASGEMKEATEWHRVAFFGCLAEYLKKGVSMYVESCIRTTIIRRRTAPIASRPKVANRCSCSAAEAVRR